jgi:hypothetical protein
MGRSPGNDATSLLRVPSISRLKPPLLGVGMCGPLAEPCCGAEGSVELRPLCYFPDGEAVSVLVYSVRFRTSATAVCESLRRVVGVDMSRSSDGRLCGVV